MALELIPKEYVAGSDDKKKPVESSPVHKGPERRKEQRRTLADRREMVRFQAKADRRGGRERRSTLGLWKNRDF